MHHQQLSKKYLASQSEGTICVTFTNNKVHAYLTQKQISQGSCSLFSKLTLILKSFERKIKLDLEDILSIHATSGEAYNIDLSH